MILFIAPDPSKVNKREGFMQRVAAIDEIFSNVERRYFEGDYDSEDFVNSANQADMIYVHSIYNAEAIVVLYKIYGNKIVTDMHGVVPEEEEYRGNKTRALELNKIEKTVFEYGYLFIVVTNAMKKHFLDKYKPSDKKEWVTLPIFDTTQVESMDKKKSSLGNIVYSGGAQAWQNVNKMIDAIRRTKAHYNYTILTHDKESFNSIAEMKNVNILTVQSSKVFKYYENATMGFILRDEATVNKVACPTKLIEYLAANLVPIVLSPKIGDFEELGYEYVTFNDFVQHKISAQKLSRARENNRIVISKLKKQSQNGKSKLQKYYAALSKKVKLLENGGLLLELMQINKKLKLAEDRVGLLEDSVKSHTINIASLEVEKSDLQLSHDKILRDMRDMANSRSFKIGKLITSPYRSISKLANIRKR